MEQELGLADLTLTHFVMLVEVEEDPTCNPLGISDAARAEAQAFWSGLTDIERAHVRDVVAKARANQATPQN